jgi:hypothetical protein
VKRKQTKQVPHLPIYARVRAPNLVTSRSKSHFPRLAITLWESTTVQLPYKAITHNGQFNLHSTISSTFWPKYQPCQFLWYLCLYPTQLTFTMLRAQATQALHFDLVFRVGTILTIMDNRQACFLASSTNRPRLLELPWRKKTSSQTNH